MLSASDALRERRLSFLLTLGLTANILEAALPVPLFLPWLKPGIANAFTLAAIYIYGFSGGFAIAIMRTLIAGFLTGQPFTSIVIGGSGGLFAALIMSLLHFIGTKKKLITLYGISMAGSAVHSMTQLFVVNLLFIKNDIVLWQYPLLGPASIITGIITGGIAKKIVDLIESAPLNETAPPEFNHSSRTAPIRFVAVILLSVIAMTILDKLNWQALASLLFLSLSLFKEPCKSRLILIRIFPLMAITFLLNLATESGRYINGIPPFTYEGLYKGAFFVFRIITISSLSILLIRARDIESLLFVTGIKLKVFAPYSRIGLRTIRAIPAVTAIFRDEYSQIKKMPLRQRLSSIITIIENMTARLLASH